MWAALVLAWQSMASYDVSVESCSVDAAELTRLTTLGFRSAGAQALQVTYACKDTSVTIGLRNPESGIRVERIAEDACCSAVDTERTLALLAAGLYEAAGAALYEVKPEPQPPEPQPPEPLPPEPQAPETQPPAPQPPEPPAPPPPKPTIVSPAPPAFTPMVRPSSPHLPDGTTTGADHIHVVGLSGRIRALNMIEPTMTYGVGLDYRAWVWPTIGFGAFATADFGSSAYTGGEVLARVIGGGGVASWRFARWPSLALATEVSGGLSVVSIEGRAATTDFAAASVTGATGNLGVALVPTVIFDRTQLSLPLGLGGLFRAPRGVVGTGAEQQMLQLDGLWVGGALRVSLGFTERVSAQPQLGGATVNRLLLASLAGCALLTLPLVTACDDDATVLWERPRGGGGFEGPTGAGGEPMPPDIPPPDPPICEPDNPMLGPCLCPPGASCMCFGEPEPEPEPCAMLCDGGGCELLCGGPTPCDGECTEDCVMHCDPFSMCNLGCAGGCTLVCEEGAFCQLWSWEGPSEMFCALGAVCECPIEQNCTCVGPGCP